MKKRINIFAPLPGETEELEVGGEEEGKVSKNIEEVLKKTGLGEYHSEVGEILTEEGGYPPKDMSAFLDCIVKLFCPDGKPIDFPEFVKTSQIFLRGIGHLLDELVEKKNELASSEDRKRSIEGFIESVNKAYASAVLVDKGSKLLLEKSEKIEFMKEFSKKIEVMKKSLDEKPRKVTSTDRNIKVFLHPVFNEISHPRLIAYEVFRFFTSEEPLVCYRKGSPLDPLAFVCTYRICGFYVP